MRMGHNLWAAAGLAGALAGSASAAPITIDAFVDDQSIAVTGGSGPASAEGGIAAPGALGNARNLLLARLDGYGTDSLTVNGGGLALLDLSSAAADAVTARLLYDGGTDAALTPDGLSGIDLGDGGNNGLIRVLARSDLVAPISITVYTDAANYSRLERSLPGLGFGAQPFQAIDFAFGDFAIVAGAGASFASVGAIVVEISGADAASLDAQLDSIVAIPEPATLPSLVMGLAALALLGHRGARR